MVEGALARPWARGPWVMPISRFRTGERVEQNPAALGRQRPGVSLAWLTEGEAQCRKCRRPVKTMAR